MKHKAIIKFVGRPIGAIGTTWEQSKEVEFEYDFPKESPKEQAIKKLYETHEHISVLSVKKI